MKDIKKIRFDRLSLTVTFHLDKKELIHNIADEAYAYSQALRSQGKDIEVQSYIADICEDSMIQRTIRGMQTAISQVKLLLSKFSPRFSHDADYLSNDWDDSAWNPDNDEEDIFLVCNVKPSYNPAMSEPIFQNVCDYVTNSVIAKHLELFYPDGAAVYQQRAELNADNIHYYGTMFKPGSVKISQQWIP